MRKISAQQIAQIRRVHGLGQLESTGQLGVETQGFSTDAEVFNERVGGGGASWRGFDIQQNSPTQPAMLQTPEGPQPIQPVIAYEAPYVNHNRAIGNVIAGGALSTLILPQNNLRRRLIIQNTSATIDLLFNFGANAINGTFLRIPADASLSNAWDFDDVTCPRDQVFVSFSGAGGTGYYVEISWAL